MGLFGFANEDSFDTAILRESVRTGVDAALIKAVIAQESGFRPDAIRQELRLNDASRGLMQLLFKTAAWLGYAGPPEGLLDPDLNISYGAAYLAYQLQRYGGDVPAAVAAYNAGTAKRTTGGAFTNQAYVDSVERYRAGYAAAGVLPPANGGAGSGGDVLTDPGAAAFWDLWATPAPAPAPDSTPPDPAPDTGLWADWTGAPTPETTGVTFGDDGGLWLALALAVLGAAVAWAWR